MDTYGRITTLFFVLACVGQAAAQATAPAHEQKPTFTMIISLKQNTVAPGAQAILNVDITNTSDKEVQLFKSRSGRTPYSFQVLDRNGKSAPLTPEGRSTLNGQSVVRDEKGNVRLLVGTGGAVPVAPGGTLHDEVVVTDYDLSQPGEYTIRLRRTDPATKLTVTSNTVTLVVAK